jgi:hypothetical protein
VGTTDFPRLPARKDHYINKTNYIKLLLTAESDMVFLIRSRRFGKIIFCKLFGTNATWKAEPLENFETATHPPNFLKPPKLFA